MDDIRIECQDKDIEELDDQKKAVSQQDLPQKAYLVEQEKKAKKILEKLGIASD